MLLRFFLRSWESTLSISCSNRLPLLPHYGTPLDVEIEYDTGSNFRVPFALVGVQSLVTDFHLISRNGIFAIFHATDNPSGRSIPGKEELSPSS
jgi:hypothetical protein